MKNVLTTKTNDKTSDRNLGKNKNIKNIIIMVILFALALGYYYYLANRNNNEMNENINTTEVSKVLAEDLSLTYPETPRAVIKFYNRILKCFYNEEYTEEELKELGLQARNLFDYELLVNNPEESYFQSLQAEIDDFNENKRSIFNIKLSSSDTVEYSTLEDREYAVVYSTYSLKENSGVSNLTHKFLLRKDENGQWKILGWELATIEATEDENEE